MKTKSISTYITALFAYAIACSVLLAHMHAGDIVRHSSNKLKLQVIAARTDDIHAKVMGDMHTHIDKMSLKNIAATVAARRQMNSVTDTFEDESLLEQLKTNLLLLQIMLTLPVRTLA